MREVTVFEAEDGSRFDTEEKCLAHESFLHAPEELLRQCRVWDSGFNPVEISRSRKCWVEDSCWIYAPSKECRDALNYFCEMWGFIYFFTGETENSTFIFFNEYLDIYEDVEEKIRFFEQKKKMMANN